MAYKNKMDMHTHTDNSPDGNHSATYMCESAVEKGIRAIAFTDHCEVDEYPEKRYRPRTLAAYFEGVKARCAFMGKLVVTSGIELGQAVYYPELADEILAAQQYDFVLASLHNLKGRQDFYYMDYDKEDVDALLREYFRDLLALVQWGNFESLAHLTYPLRYMVGIAKKEVRLEAYQEQIDAVLETLVKKKKALEINTSGLRQPYGRFLPCGDVVRRFRELGGEYLTIGSDAHFAQDVGAGIAEGMSLAKQCGFDYITLYENREPVLVSIE